MSREKNKYQPNSNNLTVEEKRQLQKQKDLEKFQKVFSKEFTGLHGKDLPKFSEHKREYWLADRSQSSLRQTLLNKRNVETSYSPGKASSFLSSPHSQKNSYPRSTLSNNSRAQTDIYGFGSHAKNSKWTTYMYNFLDTKGHNFRNLPISKDQSVSKKGTKKPKEPSAVNTPAENTARTLPVDKKLRTSGFI